MAYIRKLTSGWRAEIQRNGQRLSKVLPTKREAQAWAMEQETRAQTLKGAWRTFREAAERYEAEVSAKKDGARWESLRIAALIRHFGDKPLGELDAPDMADWRDKRLESVSGSTVLREVNLLKHILHTARDEWRWMDHDPFRGVKLPSESQPRQQRWTWQLIKRVLRAGQQRGGKTREVTEAFHIALRTAMRLQEVLQAPPVFDKRRQVVQLWKTKTTAQGVKVEVPVGRIAAKLLDRPAFAVKPNEASTLFSDLNRQLCIEGLTFHDSRATALTHMSRKVPVEVLAKVSRHKNISLLVNTYYRPTMEEIARRL